MEAKNEKTHKCAALVDNNASPAQYGGCSGDNQGQTDTQPR
jgi:hypothetical protein